jgi:hypothetical protein
MFDNAVTSQTISQLHVFLARDACAFALKIDGPVMDVLVGASLCPNDGSTISAVIMTTR